MLGEKIRFTDFSKRGLSSITGTSLRLATSDTTDTTRALYFSRKAWSKEDQTISIFSLLSLRTDGRSIPWMPTNRHVCMNYSWMKLIPIFALITHYKGYILF